MYIYTQIGPRSALVTHMKVRQRLLYILKTQPGYHTLFSHPQICPTQSVTLLPESYTSCSICTIILQPALQHRSSLLPTPLPLNLHPPTHETPPIPTRPSPAQPIEFQCLSQILHLSLRIVSALYASEHAHTLEHPSYCFCDLRTIWWTLLSDVSSRRGSERRELVSREVRCRSASSPIT